MVRHRLTIAALMSVVALTAVSTAHVSARRASAAQQTATGERSASDEAADKALLETVCGSCHDAGQVAGPFRAPAEWDELIGRMQSYGATASEAQFDQVRGYLLRSYGKANVNTSAAKDLAPVLDVTPTLADAIVKHREQNGRFQSLDDLKRVAGLDAAKVDGRKNRISF